VFEIYALDTKLDVNTAIVCCYTSVDVLFWLVLFGNLWLRMGLSERSHGPNPTDPNGLINSRWWWHWHHLPFLSQRFTADALNIRRFHLYLRFPGIGGM
jgi:hypothetical protein